VQIVNERQAQGVELSATDGHALNFACSRSLLEMKEVAPVQQQRTQQHV
jgi:hypothetical protein